MRASIVKHGMATLFDHAHHAEHGIETKIPFINRFFRHSRSLPVVLGHTSTEKVAHLIDYIHQQCEGKVPFVLSSDLSHFHPRKIASSLHQKVAKLIETGQSSKLDGNLACGHAAIRGFLIPGLAVARAPCSFLVTIAPQLQKIAHAWSVMAHGPSILQGPIF